MNTSTLPATLEQFATIKTGDIKYFSGRPRTTKFNAKKGIFIDDQEEPLTKAGASFTIIPLSYRTFVAELFKMDRRQWLEIFFLNTAGHVCSLLLHRHSVDQFVGLAASLFYEDVSPIQIQLEIKPDARSHPEHGKYYVADYAFKALPEAEKERPAEIIAFLPPVYRHDTALATEEMVRWLGYPDLKTLQLPKPGSLGKQEDTEEEIAKAA